MSAKSRDQCERVEAIFSLACDAEPAELDAFLERACDGDRLLRQEVESLLAHRHHPIGILDAPPLDRVFRFLGEADPLIGREITHYRIVAQIAAGGMGEVYLAEDLQLGRKVALKILPASVTGDAGRLRRFETEARAASALNHPGIVTIYEIGESDDLHFIAMEFIEGETLRQQMRGSRMGLLEALNIALKVASALAAAHKAGVIHRDIKPENIMMRQDGQATVLDFGIALLSKLHSTLAGPDWQAADAGSTETTAVRGTLGYMSPEQARGESVDARTDLFSLAVVLYEMVAGRRPFDGEHPDALIHALLNDDPPPISELRRGVPPALEDFVAKALKKTLDARYQTALEMLADLRELRTRLESGETQPPPLAGTDAKETIGVVSIQASIARWLARYRRWVMISGVVAAVATVLHFLFDAGPSAWVLDCGLFIIAVTCALAAAYARGRAGTHQAAASGGGAFRGLEPFKEDDSESFFGRESDTQALMEMITGRGFRFGVLYGDSGAGKTSLLTAGLTPGLKNKGGYIPIYCRSYKDPLGALLEECRKLRNKDLADGEEPALSAGSRPSDNAANASDSSLVTCRGIDYVRRVTEDLGAELVIIYDQFEELFVNFRTKRERQGFTSFVADCYSAEDLPVRFLFSIRSDFLHLISSEFDGRIPEPLMGDKRYQLRKFGEEQAEEIIEKSASQAGLPLDGALCRQVARDLAVGDSVLPSELQIVGQQLQTRRILTVREYHRAGGKEQLVHSFLEEVVQACDDKEGARLLLRSLISDDNTRRLALPLKAIVRRAQRSRDSVEKNLSWLVEARLVRTIQEEEPWRYELMHEYLIEKINQITGRVMDATQRANRLFRQYLSQSAVDRRARIPLAKVWLIHRYSDLERGERERELLKRSLQRGLGQAGVLGVLLAIGVVLTAAALSVSEKWELVKLRDGHGLEVRCLVFSPDGKRLVSTGDDDKAIVWDFARRERIATLTDHSRSVSFVAYSPDGRWFATASSDGTIIVWDAATLERAAVLPGPHRGIEGMAFTPDGRILITPTDDERQNLWRVGRWNECREVTTKGWRARAFVISHDGRWLVSQIWHTFDLRTWKSVARPFLPEWTHGALSPDDGWLVTVDSGGFVSFWDLHQYLTLRGPSLVNRFLAHRDRGRAVAYSPDGKLVATGGEDIILWDARSQTKLTRFPYTASVTSLAFSPDSRSLVSSHADGAILAWDLAERERLFNFNEHSAPVRSVAFSPDGQHVASASEDRSVIIWNTASRTKDSVLTGHSTRVSAVAFSSDGKLLASCDLHGGLSLWDGHSHERRWAIDPSNRKDDEFSYCVAISPDARWIATSFGVYTAADSKMVFEFPPDDGTSFPEIYGSAFSPNGKWLACVSSRGWIRVWIVGTWELAQSAKVELANVMTVSFSPDSKQIVTGDVQGSLRLWDVEPLREVAMLGHHSSTVTSATFSPDGREVASSSDDESIGLWDVRRRRLITRIGTHTAPVLSVAFSPEGRRLVSGGYDNSVRLYGRHSVLWGHQWD